MNGKAPKQKLLQNGGSVCTFSLGTIESYTNDREQKERTQWHSVLSFVKLAEIAGEYLSKGSSVYVEGDLKTEKWEDRDGNRKQITKVIGSKLIMLGDRRKKESKEPGDEGMHRFKTCSESREGRDPAKGDESIFRRSLSGNEIGGYFS